jgi:hypothetical protein
LSSIIPPVYEGEYHGLKSELFESQDGLCAEGFHEANPAEKKKKAASHSRVMDPEWPLVKLFTTLGLLKKFERDPCQRKSRKKKTSGQAIIRRLARNISPTTRANPKMTGTSGSDYQPARPPR